MVSICWFNRAWRSAYNCCANKYYYKHEEGAKHNIAVKIVQWLFTNLGVVFIDQLWIVVIGPVDYNFCDSMIQLCFLQGKFNVYGAWARVCGTFCKLFWWSLLTSDHFGSSRPSFGYFTWKILNCNKMKYRFTKQRF